MLQGSRTAFSSVGAGSDAGMPVCTASQDARPLRARPAPLPRTSHFCPTKQGVDRLVAGDRRRAAPDRGARFRRATRRAANGTAVA